LALGGGAAGRVGVERTRQYLDWAVGPRLQMEAQHLTCDGQEVLSWVGL
jgi:hypothetical protein